MNDYLYSDASGAKEVLELLKLDKECVARVSDKGGNCVLQGNPDLLAKIPLKYGNTKISVADLCLNRLENKQATVFIVSFDDPGAKEQKINEAELIGLIASLKIAITLKAQKVFCDSNGAAILWSEKNTDAVKRTKKECPDKYTAIKQVQALRDEFRKSGGEVEFISGDINPADFGFHYNRNRGTRDSIASCIRSCPPVFP